MAWLEHKLLRKTRDTVPYTDPLHAGRHPFQVFMLALCLVSSLPLLVGQETAGSIEATLPQWLATAWGLSLLLGSAMALLGSWWRGDYDTGLFMERVGLDFTGAAAVAYGFVILGAIGWGGLVASAITIGFGWSCLIRARDIARIFHRAAARDGSANALRVQVEGE